MSAVTGGRAVVIVPGGMGLLARAAVECRIERPTCNTVWQGGVLSRIRGRQVPVLATRRWELW